MPSVQRKKSGLELAVEEMAKSFNKAFDLKIGMSKKAGFDKIFEGGAARMNRKDAARYDLLHPLWLQVLAEICGEGVSKYGEFNWEKGLPLNNCIDHALNHLVQFLKGDRSEPHLEKAFWNLGAAVVSFRTWPHLNEQYLKRGKE